MTSLYTISVTAMTQLTTIGSCWFTKPYSLPTDQPNHALTPQVGGAERHNNGVIQPAGGAVIAKDRTCLG